MIKEFKQYNFMDFINSLGINFNDFNLTPEDFDHKSDIHGINHTFRVMFNCLMIGNAIQDKLNTKRAFMAAFIHDTARQHDNRCMMHGKNSAEKKFPLFKDIFMKNGMTDDDLSAIKLAITNHSEDHEIDKSHPYYKTVAILRDADGLDLIRIDIVVKPSVLRFKESTELIDIAEALFLRTEWANYRRFSDFLKDNTEI